MTFENVQSSDGEINLSKYDLSEKFGFLPLDWPAEYISINYYTPWEHIIVVLPELLKNGQLRNEIDNNLPLLEINDELRNDEKLLRRAYSILTFITNSYVWGNKFLGDKPLDILPDNVATPLLEVSRLLGLPPLSTYAGLILWNYRKQDDDSDVKLCDELDPIQVEILNTFTDLDDERWFYIISIFYEKIGGSVLKCGLNILDSMAKKNITLLISNLRLLTSYTQILGDLFNRMEEHTNPDVFYNVLRPYLAGWENARDLNLPNGVKYGTKGEYMKFAGGSNAQSSLIQFIDVLLNVKHKNEEGVANGLSYILEMRKYMPYLHREYLEKFSDACKLKEFVVQFLKDEPELSIEYDNCLDSLKVFRDKHVKLVSRYIIAPARRQAKLKKDSELGKKDGLATKGTGSTSFVVFLKQCRNDTVNTGINLKKRKQMPRSDVIDN